MARYEAHMTFALKDADKVEQMSDKFKLWKFSKIHGCPLMGPDAKYAYLTAYSPVCGENLLDDMESMARLCQDQQITVLRQKVERIVFDSKTGVNELAR